MKNLFGLVMLLLLTVGSVNGQYRTFTKGKNGGDIIGKDEVRWEVINAGQAITFYPINADGSAIKSKLKDVEIDVLYLGDSSSQIFHPESTDGHYTVFVDSNRIIYYYFISATIDGKRHEMKEQMVVYGK